MKRLHEELMTEAEKKEKLLQEALRIHTFLSEVSHLGIFCLHMNTFESTDVSVCVEVSELQLWSEEQRAGLESRDCGRSEEATEALLRRLDSVDVELENQRKTVERLREGGASLQHLGHPNR